MPVRAVVAVVAATLLVGNLLFQVGLATGKPWGRMAYGGAVARDDGTLPAGYRLASAGTAAVMAVLCWLVLAVGGLVTPGPLPGSVLRGACWVLAAWSLLNTLGNLASRSRAERRVMGPVTATLTVLFVLLAVLPE